MKVLPPAIDLIADLGRFHAEHPGSSCTCVMPVRAPCWMGSQRHPGPGTGRAVGQPPQGITLRRLASDRLIVACAATHPLANRDEVGLADLSGEQFVDFQPDWGLRMLLDQHFTAAGLKRSTTLEVNDVPSLLELVSHGRGVALVPELVTTARR